MKKQILIVLLMVLALGFSQSDNPVSVRLEIYLVSMVNGQEEFKESTTARPGQVVEYRLFAKNEGDTTLPPGSVTVTGPVPKGTSYIANSATPSSDQVFAEFSVNDRDFVDNEEAIAEDELISAIRWTLERDMEPNAEVMFVYRVTVNKDN